MPDPRPTGDRTPAQRQADHASLGRLSESLVPALVQKLASSGLGELEVREGDWRIRLRRASTAAAPAAARRTERPRLGGHGEREGRGREGGVAAAAGTLSAMTGGGDAAAAEPHRTMVLSPAVGVFQPGAKAGDRVRAGDRIAVVDLLGIAQDVTSPIDGTVVEVFPQAGEAVEYAEEVAAVASEVEVETDGAAGDEAAGPLPGAATLDASDTAEPPAGAPPADGDGEASA